MKELSDNSGLFRQPPNNIIIEQSLLGAILTNNDALNRVSEFLRAEHFFDPAHQKIYLAIQKYIEKGILANPITLKNYFDNDESLKQSGGADYLIKLAGLAVSIINLEQYGQEIYEYYIRRSLITIGEDIVNNAYKENIDIQANQQIESAEQKLFDIASDNVGTSGFKPINESVAEALKRAENAFKRSDKVSGIKTNFIDFDSLLGGLQDSDLIILAGRPSMGKTAFSINIATESCKALLNMKEKFDEKNIPPSVGFFSLEMSAEQLAARIISMESGVDSSQIRVGNINDKDFVKLQQASRDLNKMPFFIDDTPALTISALRTRARRLKRKNNLSLLIVDYLQLVRGSFSKGDNRVNEVSEVTQGLKAIAKELNVPVIALSQLSRAVENRDDKRPQLSDLRESGSIEQDADIVMFIYREEYYLARKRPTDEQSDKFLQWQKEFSNSENRTEIIVAKQRNGPIGNVTLRFNSNTTKFENYVDDNYLPEAH